MPLLSSPVVYPPSSSPPAALAGGPRLSKSDRPASTERAFEDKTAGPGHGPDYSKSLPTHASRDLGKRAFSSILNSILSSKGEQPDLARAVPIERHANAREPALVSCVDPSQRPLSGDPSHVAKSRFSVRTCSGKSFRVDPSPAHATVPFEELIAARSTTAPGRAKKSHYGVDIHVLLDEANVEAPPSHPAPSMESRQHEKPRSDTKKTLMWTEKYRARQFTDLVGDERTHRSVLSWLKHWDPIVFPDVARARSRKGHKTDDADVRPHRKLLMLAGPPGLGKTTLAHVCARQAGYEVLEINASDERSRDVVKGRIRDCVGTENVRGISVKTAHGKIRKAGRPVCVVVDEVDGVVSGSGAGGEGGFVKALIDLVLLDQKNASSEAGNHSTSNGRKKKKADRFRLMRPLILICNDAYHPALRPLRQVTIAEVIHVRKPPLNMVISRMKTIFEREGLACDSDGVRRLCEATWGITSRKDGGSGGSGGGEGDMRGILVAGEWAAAKYRSMRPPTTVLQGQTSRLTKNWVEQHILGDLSQGIGGSRGMGRGGTKEVVERVFSDGGGSIKGSPVGDLESSAGPNVGVAELGKRRAMDRLRQTLETCGEVDRVMTDCFSAFPSKPFQDDTLLSKPNAAYDWLHFHDTLSSRVYAGQEWELMGYLSNPVLAFHHLFASPVRHGWGSGTEQRGANDAETEPLPFSGPRADYSAYEAEKQNKAVLSTMQSSLSIQLHRSFRSAHDISTELLPWLMPILSPDVKPVIVGGSGEQRGVASVRKEGERDMVRRAVEAMSVVGVTFEKGRLESGSDGRGGGWVYRMEPPLDTLTSFETATKSKGSASSTMTRYAIRQVLDQEQQKYILKQQNEARQARYHGGRGRWGEADAAETQSGARDGNGKRSDAMMLDQAYAKAASSAAGASTTARKRDFFGRPVSNSESRPRPPLDVDGPGSDAARKKHRSVAPSTDGAECEGEENQGGEGWEGGGEEGKDKQENKVWISFHEGFSNAVRKPVTLEELLLGL
ncbi:MAG: hypothetical protein M1838_002996 [Thelocarpon superellum]|nr:MAG: hypothetical protein M1838_002996 [Thelocarpon superellum]